MILLQIAAGLFFLSCACWVVAKMSEPFEEPSTVNLVSALAFVALLFVAFVTGAVGMFFL